MVHTLSQAGLEVAVIDDPKALAVAVADNAPELLLVDATYPGVTDDDLVVALAPHVGSLPVVFFSDRPEAEIRSLVLRVGARGSVPKSGATLLERLGPFLSS